MTNTTREIARPVRATNLAPESSDRFPLAGLRVAVTGGTSGLGLALVEALRDHGADVAFLARTSLDVVALEQRLPGTHGITGDVSQKEQTHGLAMQISSALGGLDVLIHNASSLGPVPLALLADTECEDFETALATNLLGPFRLTKALLGTLAASARQGRPARVIHITSDAAENAYPSWGAYGVSKAALLHLGRIWHEELKPHGIEVDSIDPGDMDTPLHALAVPDADPTELKRPSDSAGEIVARLVATSRKAVAS